MAKIEIDDTKVQLAIDFAKANDEHFRQNEEDLEIFSSIKEELKGKLEEAFGIAGKPGTDAIFEHIWENHRVNGLVDVVDSYEDIVTPFVELLNSELDAAAEIA